jgi:hypothetical protein
VDYKGEAESGLPPEPLGLALDVVSEAKAVHPSPECERPMDDAKQNPKPEPLQAKVRACLPRSVRYRISQAVLCIQILLQRIGKHTRP